MMTDKQLLDTVERFREGLLEGSRSDWKCFLVCAPLQGYLSFLGVDTDLMESDLDPPLNRNHFWLRLKDGRCLDPTVDQFDKKLGTVYLGSRLQYHSHAVVWGDAWDPIQKAHVPGPRQDLPKKIAREVL